jgi:hypothetical protein
MWLFQYLLVLCTAFCFSLPTHAQENQSPVHIGLYATGALPAPAFKNAVDNRLGGFGAGVGANVLANPFGKNKMSPMYLGLDFCYLNFGRDKISETNTSPPYKTSFNFYVVNGIGRIYLHRGEGFTPFIDGSMGLKIFNARTKIDKDAFQTVLADEQAEVINNTTDTGLGYGIGLGFYTRKYHTNESGESRGKASFSIRLMYMWGDETSYVKRGSVAVNNGLVTLEKGYTQTNMLLIQLGAFIF